MSYKVKSLLYLICFVVAAVWYNTLESDEKAVDNILVKNLDASENTQASLYSE